MPKVLPKPVAKQAAKGASPCLHVFSALASDLCCVEAVKPFGRCSS